MHRHDSTSAAAVQLGGLTMIAADPTDGMTPEERQHTLHPHEQEQQHKEQKQQAAVTTPKEEEAPFPSLGAALLEALALVLPIIINSFLSFGLNRLFGMILVGQHFGAHEIAVVGTGMVVYSVFGISLPVGFSCGVDTLVSQNFGRDPASPAAGLYLQSGILLTWLLCVPGAVLFFFSYQPLRLIFDDNFSADLSAFLIFTIPLMFIQATNICLGRGLQAQKNAKVPTRGSLLGSVVFVVAATLLVPQNIYWYPVLLCVANATSILVVFVFCEMSDDAENNVIKKVSWTNVPLVWKEFSANEFARPKTFWAVGIGSAKAIVSEWVANEVIILFGSQLNPATTGFTNTQSLAALNVAWIVIGVLFTVPLSISVATSAFVGNSLGRNEPRAASEWAVTLQLLTIAAATSASFMLAAAGSTISGFFTTDAATLEILAERMMPVIIFFHNFQSLHISIQGIFRALGPSNEYGTGFCFRCVSFSLWMVGLPAAYCVGVYGVMGLVGAAGILAGFCAGFAVELALLMWGTTRIPWKQLAEEASRAEAEEVRDEK